MKKTLLLIASAALLLAGCAKEQIGVGQIEGGLVNATFTASLDNSVATKAAVDGDGNAAAVNRCIMEIYYGDELFTRQYAPVGSDKKATFTAQVVSNRTYKVAFWADMVDDATTDAGLATDKYYTTTSLKEIAIKGNYSGNDDARDAFFHVGNYTVAQAGSSFGSGEDKILLKRPFAQMNVITTDWDKASSATGLAPEKVKVTLKNALVKFNAVTEEASGSENLEYVAAVYTAPAPVVPVSATEKTLSMDYLFASKDKAVIDIDWKALHGTDANVEHSFAAVPYQRNYRTNIKGALLTTQGQWTVTVDPDWETDTNGDFDYAYTSVYDIQGANDFVAQNQDKKEISVTFSTQPNDAGDPSQGTPDHPINAIVTSLLKQGATYNIDVASTTDKLYVGDYKFNTTESGTTYDYNVVLQETNAAAVNLVVSDNLYIGTLVVNSPSKSVSINGQTVQSGKTYHIENLQVQEVSMNTVIIESGMVVDNLEMKKGGLEIHGTVHKATVPEGTPIADIKVRDCENLNEELVYNVLKNYIAEGYVGVKGRTTAGKWDIIPWVCKIGDTGYGTLADAVAAVQSGETITLVRDYEGDGVVVPGGKNFTLDFGGHTYKVIDNMAGSTGTKNQCFQLLKGSTLVFQNGTITTSCAKLGINTYSDITIKDLTIDMTGTEAAGQVACLETCNGTVSVEGASNLIAKEGQIATLVLYWPNGGYGDINLTMNTTGEVSGLMAYGSYQVQDLSTVAQHSHVAIKNGKYDVTFDMDNLDNYDYKISGGVFSEKPDDALVDEHYSAVANTDAITRDKYPWAIKLKSEYAEISIAKTGVETEYALLADFRDRVNAGNSFAGYTVTLLKDVIYSSSNYWTPIGYMYGTPFSGTFDGGGHKVEGLNIDTEQLGSTPNYWPGGFFGSTGNGAKIKNLKIYGDTDCAGMVGYAEYTDISDCESHMDSYRCYNISGGFIAHADAYVTLSNCKNYGSFICTTSASYLEVGGFVGRFYGGDHCSVINCENHGNISWEGENGGGAQRSLGGIVAGFYNASAISNPQKCVISGCKNYGTIYNKNATSGTTTSTSGGIGGIVGKPFLQANGIGVTISDCTNSGNIISSGRAGGIVGALNEAWQNVGKYSAVSGCTNSGTIYGTDGSRGQIYGIMGTNASDPDKDNVLSNNLENGILKTYDEYSN